MPGYNKQKMNIGLYISALFIIIALIVVFFIMYKYTVEGEATPAFKISKMVVVSSAKTDDIQKVEDSYTANVIQNNDVKISIEKNPEYKKDAIIRKVIINNIQIDKKETIKDIEIYRPSQGTKLYEYEEQYKIGDSLEYLGAQETYLKGENLEISNQGGIIDFSIIINKLGVINYKEDEQIKVDGTLLNALGIEEKDVKFQLKFYLIIELEDNIKLKTKMTLDLPTGNILQEGVETKEYTDLKTVFKRI